MKEISWSPLVPRENGTGYFIRLKYRAKNAFGAYIVDEQVFTLDESLKVVGATEWSE
jgi:hypothetical protein